MPECEKVIDVLKDPSQRATARSQVTESVNSIHQVLVGVKQFIDAIGEDVSDYIPDTAINKQSVSTMCLTAVSAVGKKRVADAMTCIFNCTKIDDLKESDYALAHAVLNRLIKGVN
jgi:hypothetical protein